MKHNILVIGCGSIGQRHARLLSQRDDVNLVLADNNISNINKAKQVSDVAEVYSDYEQALDDGVDGAIICTPNAMHVNMAEEVLKSGAHVLVEKPVGLSVEESKRLCQYDERKPVLIGYMGRFHKQLKQVKAMIDSGELGNIIYGNASVYTYGTLLCANTDFRDTTKWSLVVDYTHEIDFLNYLLGEAKEVVSVCQCAGELEHRPDPNVMEIMLRYKSGAVGSIHMDYVRYPDKRTLEIVGDKGSIELYMNQGLLRVYNKEKQDFREISMTYNRDQMFLDEHQNFIDVIQNKAKPYVSLNDGINALEVADAAIESCKKHAFISLK